MAAAQTMAMTMTQKIVAIAVTIIIISTVALPIIDDAEAGIKVVTQNTGQTFSMVEQDNSTDYTITYISSSSVSINGVIYPINTYDIILYSDGLTVDIAASNMRVTTPDYLENTTEIVLSGGTATYTNTSSIEHTADYSWFLIMNTTGNYGLFRSGEIFINEESTLYYTRANTSFTNSDLDPSSVNARGYVMAGTFDNLKSVFAQSNTTGVTSIELSGKITGVTEVSKGVYSVKVGTNKIDAVADTNLGEYTNTAIAMSIIAAPLNYYYYDDSSTSMFGIVAIMLILVPVMLAVRMITLRRN